MKPKHFASQKTVTQIIAEGLDECVSPGKGWGAEHQNAMELANASPKLLEFVALVSRMTTREEFEEIADSEDAQDTLDNLIASARAILAKLPEAVQHQDAFKSIELLAGGAL